MTNNELTQSVRKLASDANLRSISKSRSGSTWVGIHAGILIVMQLDSFRLQIEFTSPDEDTTEFDKANSVETGDTSSDNGSMGEDTLEEEDTFEEEDEYEYESDAFRRVSAAGLPGDWFDQNEEGPWGFTLFIDEERRKQLSPVCLDGILPSLTSDLHDLGADDSHPCSQCPADATTLGYFDSPDGAVMAPYCASCWKATQESTGGVIRVGQPIYAWRGWAFMIGASIVFGVVWGFAQHPNAEIPFHLLFIGCAAAGVGIAMGTSSFAQGSSLALRIGVAICVLMATLVGNMLGVKFLFADQGIEIPWLLLAPAYLIDYLPFNFGQELLFFSGGVVGVVAGFQMLRKSERVIVR